MNTVQNRWFSLYRIAQVWAKRRSGWEVDLVTDASEDGLVASPVELRWNGMGRIEFWVYENGGISVLFFADEDSDDFRELGVRTDPLAAFKLGAGKLIAMELETFSNFVESPDCGFYMAEGA